jgi:catalase (peroxidase I)
VLIYDVSARASSGLSISELCSSMWLSSSQCDDDDDGGGGGNSCRLVLRSVRMGIEHAFQGNGNHARRSLFRYAIE